MKTTLKDLRNSESYVSTFLTHGNAKLTDYTDENGNSYKYAQFNLPAKTTCPYASSGCKKFCYAKRDERWTSVKRNRNGSLVSSKSGNFSENMIYTIDTEFNSKRFSDSHMILRLHESGDFYSPEYLSKWVNVFDNYNDTDINITFQFYTKCFDYFLNLSDDKKEIIRNGLANGKIGASWSLDDTMSVETKLKAIKLLAMYPYSNIYHAVNDVDSIKHDDVCDCADCGKCQNCVKTSGKIIAVQIH